MYVFSWCLGRSGPTCNVLSVIGGSSSIGGSSAITGGELRKLLLALFFDERRPKVDEIRGGGAGTRRALSRLKLFVLVSMKACGGKDRRFIEAVIPATPFG